MSLSEKISATVITGFLGAGKTTIIQNILQNNDNRRIALIINEFGDVGIDGDLLKGCGNELCTDDDIVELANGCICCTVADDFIPTMERLLEKEIPPEHIIIETSGLALPEPLVRAFNWPEIRTKVNLDGVVTVVDGAALKDGQFAADEAAVETHRQMIEEIDHESPLSELFEDQIETADMIILNKADLLDQADIEKIRDDLETRSPEGVTVIPSQNGELRLEVILGLWENSTRATRPSSSHHHDHDDHDHEDFENLHIQIPPLGSREVFLNRLSDIIREHNILRIKGILAEDNKPMRLIVQAAGPRVNSYYDRPWQTDEQQISNLILIGHAGLDRNAIVSALAGDG